MPTAHYVDSGFWNFDALFVPQQVSYDIIQILSELKIKMN